MIVFLVVLCSMVSPGVQSLVIILLMAVALYIQLRFMPYYDPALNNMETYSLVVIILTIYSGLYFQAG